MNRRRTARGLSRSPRRVPGRDGGVAGSAACQQPVAGEVHYLVRHLQHARLQRIRPGTPFLYRSGEAPLIGHQTVRRGRARDARRSVPPGMRVLVLRRDHRCEQGRYVAFRFRHRAPAQEPVLLDPGRQKCFSRSGQTVAITRPLRRGGVQCVVWTGTRGCVTCPHRWPDEGPGRTEKERGRPGRMGSPSRPLARGEPPCA